MLVAMLVVEAPAQVVAQCPDGSAPPCSVRRSKGEPYRIALLYFDNLSRDSAEAYLADGISEDLLIHLGRVRRLALKHASRAAVRRIRDSLPNYLETLGQLLAVRYIVEGAVRRSGGRLRVTARLVRTADGVEVWHADYERTTSDRLALEEEIAHQVAVAIVGQLVPTEIAAIHAARPAVPSAHDHYIHGNFYLAQRTNASLGRAMDEYQSAYRDDPAFADALGRLGYAYGLCLAIGFSCRGLSDDSMRVLGRKATESALAQDSNSAEALSARAMLNFQSDPPVAERSLQRAIQRAPATRRFGTITARS